VPHPVTPAVRALRAQGISFVPHVFDYVEHGGTRHSAQALQVPEHEVIKTLVMETDAKDVLLVLMHGEREVSTRQLARVLGVKRVEPADPSTAQRATGYVFGGTSPFGTRKALPVYVEKSILALERIFINGGKRGFLVEISPLALERVLAIQEVEVATS
jgi:Cys-tRNA(Pro) deacylase